MLVGEFTDIKEAIEAEKALPAGEYEVRADLLYPLSQERLNELQDKLISHGVQLLAPISQTDETLSVLTIRTYKPAATRGIAFVWVLPILGILAGAGILGITLWRSTAIIDSLAKLAIPLGLIAVAGVAIYVIGTRK